MVPVTSDTIEAIGYDASRRELHVRFTRAGSTYVYRDVGRAVYEEFLRAESKGAFFYSQVRDVYSSRQASAS